MSPCACRLTGSWADERLPVLLGQESGCLDAQRHTLSSEKASAWRIAAGLPVLRQRLMFTLAYEIERQLSTRSFRHDWEALLVWQHVCGAAVWQHFLPQSCQRLPVVPEASCGQLPLYRISNNRYCWYGSSQPGTMSYQCPKGAAPSRSGGGSPSPCERQVKSNSGTHRTLAHQ